MPLPGLAAQGPPSRSECPGPGGGATALQLRRSRVPLTRLNPGASGPQPRPPRGSCSQYAPVWRLLSSSVVGASLLKHETGPVMLSLALSRDFPSPHWVCGTPLWPHPASGAWPPPPPLLAPPQSWLSSRQAQCYPRAFAPAVSGTSFTHALAPESSFPFSSAPLPSPPLPIPPCPSPPFH